MPTYTFKSGAQNVNDTGVPPMFVSTMTAPDAINATDRPNTSWSRRDLLAYAMAHNFVVPEGATKREILELINQEDNYGNIG